MEMHTVIKEAGADNSFGKASLTCSAHSICAKKTVTLLTGLPRSGTTLVCALLNELPDTVALVEPIAFEPDGNHDRALRQIEQFIDDARLRVIDTGEVTTRHIAGVIPDNLVDPPGPGLRRFHSERGVIPLRKVVTPEFRLFVKHLGEFTAMSSTLAANHPLVAIVRNPLHLLAAWQTVDLPIRQGHLRSAECFSPKLAQALAIEDSPLRRQVILIEWMLKIYQEFPPERILRYEDLVEKPQRSLFCLGAQGDECSRLLQAYDPSERYPGADFVAFARELQTIAPLVSHFYPDFEAQLRPYLR
jgi:hypothetical protein